MGLSRQGTFIETVGLTLFYQHKATSRMLGSIPDPPSPERNTGEVS